MDTISEPARKYQNGGGKPNLEIAAGARTMSLSLRER